MSRCAFEALIDDGCYSLAVRFDRMGVSRGSSGVWQLYCSRLNRRAVLAVPSSSPVEFGGLGAPGSAAQRATRHVLGHKSWISPGPLPDLYDASTRTVARHGGPSG